MNKTLILLLVTLVQSQSDGVVLSKDGSRNSQSEDWDAVFYSRGVIKDYDPYSEKTFKKRLVTGDGFTRRSVLDKNFMRFGRGEDGLQKHSGRGPSEGGLNFHRLGRGLKDNFIRFGRGGDNFIRFGRGGGKDGFIRFGKTLPDDFFRAGKSLRENFIRFGKSDENFIRFGRENTDEHCRDFLSSEKPFRRVDKSTNARDDYLGPEKSEKNGTNFPNGEADDADDDYNVGKEAKRRRRSAQPPARDSKRGAKRSTRFFERPPTLEGSRQESFRNFQATPSFPVYPILSIKNF